MRKYLFSGAVLGALISGIGVVRSTLKGPRNILTIFEWLAWAATMGVAVIAVRNKADAVRVPPTDATQRGASKKSR
ncbi:MAG: hypothetical protein B5766_05915 [Candidatus Lumbricidophila eiseniae]|uniref:NADH:ubiquinone oxidoreductase n=1 Tax=Candidatus Lumbricidiphila eiseniae TaxID=1969409 RepID=A0A2A6FS04_9MICO|nr:MAG: hypothetical protein B5766_05915 [Candidatus Lumbricidophila eiseniae]